MSLVFAGVCSHAPGITARAERADPELREQFYSGLGQMRRAIVDSGAEVLIVVAAEHFANFFMNNMPAYCIGMADSYSGPIEDPDWLKIERVNVPGCATISKQVIAEVMQTVDVAYAEEWRFDHGISVPLHFLTPEYDLPIIPININCQGPPLSPVHRAWAFGKALRRAVDKLPQKFAIVGTGGISHWPATPDSGKINAQWDRDFLKHFLDNDKEKMLQYNDDVTIYADAGQGGFEIRTFIATAASCEGAKGQLIFYAPIPIFAVGCTVAWFDL